jgi:hypothetical protein
VQVGGIVADGKYTCVSEQVQPAAFLPILQRPDTGTTLVMRSQVDAFSIAAASRQLVRDMDPAVPFEDSGAWSSQLALRVHPAQAATVALGIFGAFGLLLSSASTFGLACYTVSKRLRELSIRVAPGNTFPRARTDARPTRQRRPGRPRAGVGRQPPALLRCVRRPPRTTHSCLPPSSPRCPPDQAAGSLRGEVDVQARHARRRTGRVPRGSRLRVPQASHSELLTRIF